MWSRPLPRRSALKWAGAALLVAGCGESGRTTGNRAAPGQAPPRSSAPTDALALPPAPAYQPLPGEPVPNAKQTASDFVQALTTRSDGETPADVLATAATFAGAGFDAASALAVATPLYVEPVSAGEIIYPQLGGLQPLTQNAQAASVMVVARQTHLSPKRARLDVVRVFDVRLAVQDGRWRVVELASAGGEPVDRPAGLDPRTVRALNHPDLELPDSARWDIHAGRVSMDLLDVLAAAADAAPLAVTVLQTGHPIHVFGTTTRSNHNEGRAVDIWRIAGRPLVATGADSGPAGAVLRSAFQDDRTSQTGSPEGSDLDGPRSRRSFVNLVHKDHLHLAVKT